MHRVRMQGFRRREDALDREIRFRGRTWADAERVVHRGDV